MARPSYRDQGLVLRTHDFGEADRVVVLFTREHGIVRGVAKGCRRAGSRFGARLQPFVHLHLLLYPGKNLATIAQADTIDFFGGGLIDHVERYMAGCAVLDCSGMLSFADVADPVLFDLTVKALGMIRTSDDPVVILDGFLLHGMRLAGFEPSLFNCAQCGAPGPHHAFHPAAGGAVCGQCRPPQCATPPEEALRFLWWLDHDRMQTVTDFLAAGPAARSIAGVAHQLVKAYFQWHVERTVGALKILDDTDFGAR